MSIDNVTAPLVETPLSIVFGAAPVVSAPLPIGFESLSIGSKASSIGFATLSTRFGALPIESESTPVDFVLKHIGDGKKSIGNASKPIACLHLSLRLLTFPRLFIFGGFFVCRRSLDFSRGALGGGACRDDVHK